MELVVHDVTEQILEKLPPKSLLRFKSVSKQWKSTIESSFFQHKHLSHHRQKSKNPDLFLITINDKVKKNVMTLELESSIFNNISIPWEKNHFQVCENSIDGLICVFNHYDSTTIFNPATRWYRTLPPSTYQQTKSLRVISSFGFGKDQINGLYKPVWLYNNSLKLNSANATICEVFDFNINAWRFIEPSSPNRISDWFNPVYLNGLLYWLAEKDEEEIKSVLSFDLHTETFEIVCKAPSENYLTLYNLNDELCISDDNDMEHSYVIWSLNLKEKTWKKIYFIDLHTICSLYGYSRVRPVVFMEEEKKRKFMLCSYICCYGQKQGLILHDSQTTSYRVVAKGNFIEVICYFHSLISIL